MHPEVWAAFAMILPSVVALNFAALGRQFWDLQVAALGCIMHCPFSFLLHIYRAFGGCVSTRIILYKLDVSFIHVHTLCQLYAWRLRHRTFDYFLHFAALAYLWTHDDTEDPAFKMVVNVLVAVAVLQSSLGLVRRHFLYWLLCVAVWGVAFWLHAFKPLGDISSAVFHALLAAPQGMIMLGMLHHNRKLSTAISVDEEGEDEEEEEEDEDEVEEEEEEEESFDFDEIVKRLSPLMPRPRFDSVSAGIS